MPLTAEQIQELRTQLGAARESLDDYRFYGAPKAADCLWDATTRIHDVLARLVDAMAEPPVESEGCTEAEQEAPQTHEHEFVLRIPSVSAFDDDIEEALISAGIDDGTMSWREGVFRGRFTRSAPTRDEAIQSAIADVRRAGIEAVLEEER